MSAQFLQPDMASQFYSAIASDSKIKDMSVRVDLVLDRKVIATTKAGGIGNKYVAVTKTRCGPFQWNCGGVAGQVRESIKIDIIARAVEGNENCRELCQQIKGRIKTLLFDAEFLGTGWLFHKIVQDGFPSAPLKSMAYCFLVYEVMVSEGHTKIV